MLQGVNVAIGLAELEAKLMQLGLLGRISAVEPRLAKKHD
jgi:hypothetical protein